MNNYHQALLPDRIYHLFSRAVGKEQLFLSTDNYLFFLQKLKQHTNHICKFYCYSLLPNHFHLLVKIADKETIIAHFETIKKRSFNDATDQLSDFIMERFSNCLNSYSKAFNKVNNRKGALFMDFLKRSVVNDETDFTSFIWYIHKNAVHHQLTKKIGLWPHDSYKLILSTKPTALLRQDVIDWFGDKEAFIEFHQQEIELKADLEYN